LAAWQPRGPQAKASPYPKPRRPVHSAVIASRSWAAWQSILPGKIRYKQSASFWKKKKLPFIKRMTEMVRLFRIINALPQKHY
jgi:hypothetical protein